MNKVLESFAAGALIGMLTVIALYLVFMFGAILIKVFGL